MLAMLAIPAALTLHTVRISATVDVSSSPNPSPHGYTVSLLLFIVPIAAIALWFLPREHIHISKRSFWRTILVLFPLGAALDFFFAHVFFTFPNPGATLGIRAPAIGGGVPLEEYVFYLTGFSAVLLMYIWLDEYWLRAYAVPGESNERANFSRLIQFHPESLALAAVLVAAAVFYRRYVAHEIQGFPGYFTFLVLGALVPSTIFFPAARNVINWRALSLTLFVILLTSLLWEATLAVPYGWWGFQSAQMLGVTITAWAHLPIEEVLVWIAVTWVTVIVYEIVRRWQASGRRAKHAFFGL